MILNDQSNTNSLSHDDKKSAWTQVQAFEHGYADGYTDLDFKIPVGNTLLRKT